MIARRFRLDKFGNLHADGLFCRVLVTDPALKGDAKWWLAKKNVEARSAKAKATVGFEHAWAAGERVEAMDLARNVHVLMLAQRFSKPTRRISTPDTTG